MVLGARGLVHIIGFHRLNRPKRLEQSCKYLRANQNAERLHGSTPPGGDVMNSPVPCLPDPIQNMKRTLARRRRVAPKRAPRARRNYNAHAGSAPYSAAGSGYTPPTAYGAVMGAKASLPVMVGVGKTMTVCNYELVTSFTNSGGPAFNSAGFVVNPGLAPSFPWLSNIAQSYQRFRFKRLRFFYVPAVATSNDGSAYLYLQYDYQDSAPTSLAEVMVSESSCSGNVWFGGPVSPELAFREHMTTTDNIFVDYDPRRATQPWYYIRSGQSGVTVNTGGALTGTPTGGIGTLAFTQGAIADPASRPCTIFYGTDGVPSGVTTAGRLYVAYEVELSDPVAPALDN